MRDKGPRMGDGVTDGRTEREAVDQIRSFEGSLPMLLLRAREAVMLRFRPTLRAHDLTEQQWRVLRALNTAAEMRVSDLSALSFISMPSLSRILRSMEARGLLQRRVTEQDLRSTLISVTVAGRQVIRSVAPEAERAYAEITAIFGGDRLDHLDAALRDLASLLGIVPPAEGVEP